MKETQQMSVAGAYEHKLSHAQQLLTPQHLLISSLQTHSHMTAVGGIFGVIGM